MNTSIRSVHNVTIETILILKLQWILANKEKHKNNACCFRVTVDMVHLV